MTLWAKTVAHSDCESLNASVYFARWQKDEKCVWGVCVVIHNAVGFVVAVSGVNVHNEGKRDSDDLISRSHYPVKVHAIQYGSASLLDSDTAA